MGWFSSIVDPGGVFSGDTGDIANNLLDPGGALLESTGLAPSWLSDTRDKASDYIGDIADFEMSQLSDWTKKFKNDPTQLLIGAGDPFSTKVWNKALGTDYTPYVNQYGGATNEAYQSAENKGIDTSNAQGLGQAAQMIASYFGGQGMGAGFGAAGSAAGIGAGAGQVLGGAAVGAGNSWVNGSNIAQGAVAGGLGGYLNSLDYSNGLLDNPILKRGFNGAVGGALSSGIAGNSMTDGALAGAIKGGAKGVGQYYSEYDMPDVGTIGGTVGDDNGERTNYGELPNYNQQQSNSELGGGLGNYYGMTNYPTYNAPVQQQQVQQKPQQSAIQSLLSQLTGQNTAAGQGNQTRGMQGQQAGQGGLSGAESIASGLMGLYQANKTKRDVNDQINQLNSLFTNDSAYGQTLRNQLNRRDAAAGRRSQSGVREVELQAKLAELASRQSGQLNSLYNQKSATNLSQYKDLYTMLRNTGALSGLSNAAQSYFNGFGGE